MRKNHKVPYIEQLQKTECGLCCVAMILRYYESFETLQDLREYLDVGRDGASITELSKLMKKLNFNNKIYKTTVEGLKQITLPAILFWENSHFVIIEKIDKKYAYIVDPSLGRRRINYEDFRDSFSSYVLTSIPNKEFKKKKKTSSVWSYFYPALFEKKGLFAKIAIFSLITYLCTLAMPIVIQKLVDKVLLSEDKTYISTSFSIVFIVLGIYGLLQFINGAELIKLRLHIDKRVNTNLIDHLLKVPYKFFDMRSKADILFATNSTVMIRELFAQKMIKGFIDLGAIVFIVFYMLKQSIALSSIVVLLFIINIISVLVTRPYILESNQYIIGEQSKLQGIQVESIYSILGIKMSAIEKNIFNAWEERYNKYIKKYKYSEKLNNYINTINEIINLSSPIIVLCVSIYYLADGEISVGQVLAFYTLSQTFFSLSTSIFSIWNSVIITEAYLERVKDIITTEEEDNIRDEAVKNIDGSLMLKDVSFSYTKHGIKVLKNINLRVEKGQKIAIVGASGSGKSTLAKLLVGLYMPTDGEVYYGDVSLQDINKKDLRKQMGIVPQDVTLFSKSIFDNIIMEREDITMEMVRNACKLAQIDEEIKGMPMGYYTAISEMGANLSGGQRQRIALARAILTSPKIIILDEATSSLDNINEKKISNYLQKIGCTRIVIAHRLSTIIDSDNIIVIDDGRLVEEGTHNELLKAKGKYYELYYSNNTLLHESENIYSIC